MLPAAGGGVVFGTVVRKPNKLVNTVLSFMLVYFSIRTKLLCTMLSVKVCDAVFLFEQTDIIIKGVKGEGGELVAIM